MSLKILSLFDGFFVGGSRIVHTDIITGLHKDFGQSHSVLSLTNRMTREFTLQKAENTATWKSIDKAGIPIQALNRDVSSPWTDEDLSTLKKAVDETDIILSLKEQPLPALDLIEWEKPLVVSVHRSDPKHQGLGLSEMVDLVGKNKLSRVVSCAYSAKDAYVSNGIPENLINVVHNGIDLNRFRNDETVRRSVRQEIGVSDDTPVVMIAARFDTMKNIPLFIQSANEFLKIASDAVFIVCGTGMTVENPEFQKLLDEYVPSEHHSHFVTYGITDTSMLYPAADILSLTSVFGEAAPLCILEGMACGAVPVSTDVGDSKLLVGDRGIVSSFNPQEIANDWAEAYKNRRIFQKRIFFHRPLLSDRKMIESYAKILEDVAS